VNSSTSSSESDGPLARIAAAHALPGDPRYLLWYACCALLLVLALGTANYAVDPLQFYRRAGGEAVFSENQRYQNPGLARNFEYETVIIGTSHAENFEPRDVLRVLGEHSLKLAISGSTAREQRMILELAIRTGRVSHVIWALDHIAFKRPADQLGTRAAEFPEHLYGEGRWAALRTVGLYLLSLDSLGLSARSLLGIGHRELETLNSWHADYEFSEARALADWHRRGAILDRFNLDATRRYGPTASQSQASIRANLVPVMRAHPEIRFDLFFPPFSILAYLADHRAWPGAYPERQRYKAFVVEATADLPNVRVFDFQGQRPITHELDNYKDLEHYRIEVNDYVLRSIASGRHRVDAPGYADELSAQRGQVDAYRSKVCALGSARPELCPHIAGTAQPRRR
jgi:hypothetical protein